MRDGLHFLPEMAAWGHRKMRGLRGVPRDSSPRAGVRRRLEF